MSYCRDCETRTLIETRLLVSADHKSKLNWYLVWCGWIRVPFIAWTVTELHCIDGIYHFVHQWCRLRRFILGSVRFVIRHFTLTTSRSFHLPMGFYSVLPGQVSPIPRRISRDVHDSYHGVFITLLGDHYTPISMLKYPECFNPGEFREDRVVPWEFFYAWILVCVPCKLICTIL